MVVGPINIIKGQGRLRDGMLASGVQWLVKKVAIVDRGFKLNLYCWKLKIMIPGGCSVAYVGLISLVPRGDLSVSQTACTTRVFV